MLRGRSRIVAEFSNSATGPATWTSGPRADVIDDFTAADVDAVYLVYTEFVNTLVQRPESSKLLPIQPRPRSAWHASTTIFEPRPGAVLERAAAALRRVQIYQALLESIASEQSARMVAMRNATDNAKELIDR